MMTQAAQSALRRGRLIVPDCCFRLISSYRAAYQERSILHPLQLRQQDHASYPISLHEVPVLAVAGEGSGEESG